jgi:DNA polymerase elongation subunit (family B)
MYKKVFAQNLGKNKYLIHLWEDTKYSKVEWVNQAYVECKEHEATHIGINGEPLKKTPKWENEDSKLHFHDMTPYQKFLVEKYGINDEPSTTHREIFFDIETEMGDALTEEYIKSAPKKVTSIAWYDKQVDLWGILILDAKGELTSTKSQNKEIIPCKTESELLARFLEKFREMDPDIIVGWNCIPKTSRIWKYDEIIDIQNSHIGDKLGCVEDKIVQYVSSGIKQEYTIKLANGNTIKSSKDHIFPTYEKTSKYQNINQLLKNKSDKKVEDLMKINNDLYFEVVKGNNPNLDQTYKILGGGVETISRDDLYLLGLIFTDGWYHNEKNDKSSISISNSCTTLIESIIPLVNNNRTPRFQLNSINDLTPHQSKDYPNAKPNYSIRIGSRYNNGEKFNLLKSFIYDGDNKSLNINLLSKLSISQFTSFVSGMIDGDGGVRNKFISYCNYEDNIHKFHELLLWNGVYSTIESNNTTLNIPYCNIFNNKKFIDNLNLRGYKKEQKENILEYFEFNNKPSSNSKKYVLEGKVLIRIQEIANTGKEVEMCDISTEKGYFIYEGVKTHNCDYFDIPYLYYRMCNVLGEDMARYLSPIGYVRETPWYKDQFIQIAGVESLDYMRLHKKFSFADEPSFKLDAIGEKYAGIKKIEYEGNLNKLFEEDTQKFIQYNFRDVEILKVLDEKLEYLNLVKNLSHKGKVNYSEVYSSTKVEDGAISAYLLSQNIIPPSKDRNPITKDSYAGGYLFCPKAGVYNYMFDEDLTSLYPSIIMTLNIGKETYVARIIDFDERNSRLGLNDLKQRDPNEELTIENYKRKRTKIKVKDFIDFIITQKWTISANGVCFRTDRESVLSLILKKWFEERSFYKKKMQKAYKEGNNELGKSYHLKQYTMKIALNATYGSLAVPSFRYGGVILAEATTLSGQRIICESALTANTHINKVMRGEITL